MSEYPNIARLALADPDKLTSRQLQVHVIRQDYEKSARGSMAQVDKDARMAAAVPALLAHINELYGQIDALKEKCGKQAAMLAHHCERREEVLKLVEKADPTSGAPRFRALMADILAVLTGGGAR